MVDRAVTVFAGLKGTLSLFVQVWGGSRIEVLGLLLGSHGEGRAGGGFVGAAYVFQVKKVT